jgi:hypothetical protein
MNTNAVSVIESCSELIVQLLAQSDPFVGRRERECLSVLVETGIRNQLEFLQEVKSPKRRRIRPNFRRGRASLDGDDGSAGTSNLPREVLLAKLPAKTGDANARTQPDERLSGVGGPATEVELIVSGFETVGQKCQAATVG